VDLVYYGSQRQLEYDFIVAPGVDPAQIALNFEGATGATLEDDGDLLLRTANGGVVLHAPVVYQEIGGLRRLVEGAWHTDGERKAGFSLGPYDITRPLVIDPVVEFATYLGGSGAEDGLDNMGVAVDSTGHIYVAGTTDSADFPTTGDIQDQFAGTTDAFVVKLDPTGTTTLYATYLGGRSLDSAQAIAIDKDGNAYVGGFTDSVDFPTRMPLQQANGGSFDGFVAKLDSTGSALVYSTYVGGSGRDFVLGLDVDDQGQVHVAGDVESPNFPTFNPLQPQWGGVWDAWAAKLTASGDSFVFSTYVGGSSMDAGLDIEVDADGFIYVAGFTISSNFPTANASQNAIAGDVDAYVLKLEADGSAFVYSTYLGGGHTDRALGIDVDAFGHAYVVGDTFSVDFPAVNPIVGFGGFADAYVAKFEPAGTVTYTTFVGGGVADHGLAIAVDGSGNAHITGMTFSDGFVLVQPLQDAIAGGVDAFVTSIDATGTRVTFSTFLGGGAGERGLAIAVDRTGNIIVVGDTFSGDFPTVQPIQSELDGLRDIFVVKISKGMDIIQDPAIQIDQVAAGLLAPRAMASIGQGDWLILENRGWMRRVRDGVVNPKPVLELPVDGTVAGRPYGLAVHPSFPVTPHVYVYFTEVDRDRSFAPLGHRLYRYTWSGTMLQTPQLLLHIPVGPKSGAEAGTIAFGQDGKLYLTSGDTGTASELQNVVGGAPPDHTGVVMRLNEDGTAPSDNPFFPQGGNLANYLGYGIRSSAAIATDPVSGALWTADNGVTSYDEINVVRPGFNGGWSSLHGPAARNSGESPVLVAFPGSAYHDPAFSWRVPVVPSAMVFLDSGQVGDHYRNHLFVGSAIDGNLYRFKPSTTRDALMFFGPGMGDRVADDHAEASEALFGVGFGSISDLEVGTDGLYVLSSALGGIYRVFWRADVELGLSTTDTSVTQGGTVLMNMQLENKTNERQDVALLLSIMMPSGVEFPLVGPVPLSLAPHARTSADLPVPLPQDAQLGTWTFKGLIARPQAQEPDVVDTSAVDFDVLRGSP
jgi:glucose/arabinose dehydrogenase